MAQLQLAALLALLCMAALAAAGCVPYRDEFRSRSRQAIAAVLFAAILAVTVFYPLTLLGSHEVLDPEVIRFPDLFVAHAVLAAFLAAWWWLRGDLSVQAFLRISSRGLLRQIGRGLLVGGAGWIIAVGITGAAAAAVATHGTLPEPIEVPPIIAWLAALPVLQRLLIVVAAMTVEEAFFRAFLQPRVGLVVSSLLFACSHCGYGLPFLVLGVFAISLVIGRSFARTGTLLPCIVAHGVFDAIQLFVILPLAVRAWGVTG